MDEINSKILSMIPSCSRTYLSSNTFLPTNIDSVIDDIDPPKMVHGMNFSGFPNHEIGLKVRVPVVLLRNLDLSIGLYIGTRLIIERLGTNVV